MFRLVALVAIAIGAILTFRLFAQSTPSPTPANNYTLSIDGDPLPVKNVEDFKKLLNTMETGNYQSVTIYNGLGEEKGPPFPIVITSTVTPSRRAQGEIARPGVHVAQRVTTRKIEDFQKVLNLFATPTPTPATKPTPTATMGK